MTTFGALNLLLAVFLSLLNPTNDSPPIPACCGQPTTLPDPSSDPPISQLSGDEAKQLFERFKTLDGAWIGRSSKGWTEEITRKTIANGSVIYSTSFDAHPNETMLTLMHLDGERLMLTHYCVARNQPRLVATKVEENGNKVTFEFLDATNLPSRNKGHMDKIVFRFLDEKRTSSQWTWYQDGKEQWLEEIISERKN